MELFGMEIKLFGFLIAFSLLCIIPVWFLNFFDMGFFNKVGLTLVLGVVTFIAVHTGGTKRGFLTR